MKRLSYLLALSIGLVGVAGTGVGAVALQATPIVPAFESTENVLTIASRIRRSLRFRVSASRYRRGGFSRGACPAEGAAPVVPVAEDGTDLAPSYLTASAHPTFFIRVPALADASGVVYVEDPESTERNPQIYAANFEYSGEAGIVGVKMPADAPALQEGSAYKWRAVINCSAEENSTDTMVIRAGGVIERTADISGTEQERLEYYLDAGIWQETAEILAQERYQNPAAQADEDWKLLMEASGVPQFAETPIVGMMDSRIAAD